MSLQKWPEQRLEGKATYMMMSRIAICAALVLATGACASFEGMPRPAPPSAVEDYYGLQQVRARIDAERDPLRQRAIRNSAVAMHIRAADQEYVNFLVSLGVDRKGANLLLDVGAIGLSSIGAVSNGSANEISAAVAAVSGARGSVNKELYYEQTLPAIIGAMETNRLRVKGEIRSHLLNDDVMQYPVEQALSDLVEYRLSQSLDRAILQVTKNAGQAADVQSERYENATKSCAPQVDVRPFWLRINHYAYDLADAAKNGAPVADTPEDARLIRLAQVAALLSGTPTSKATNYVEAKAQAKMITDAAVKYCTKETAGALVARIGTETGEVIP